MRWLKLSALFVCTVLGAGFATGRELSVYFIKYGIWGFVGIAISSVLFGFAAYKTLQGNYNNVGDIFVFPFNKFFSVVTFIFLVVLYSAMLSAGGELLRNLFKIPFIAGVLIMSVISQMAISGGNNRIANLSFVLCPFILIISVITSIYILNTNPCIIHYTEFNENFIFSAVIYSAYNIITAITVLVRENEKPFRVSLLSGIIIFALAVCLSMPLYFNYGAVINETLPLFALLHKNNIVYILYIFMLLSAIFTTAVSNGYSASVQYNIASPVITLTALLISFVGFDIIVEKIYYLFGLLGLILIIFLFLPIELFCRWQKK